MESGGESLRDRRKALKKSSRKPVPNELTNPDAYSKLGDGEKFCLGRKLDDTLTEDCGLSDTPSV